MTVNWSTELSDQTDFQWKTAFRPRLDALTDEQYFWEPAPGSWSIRPRGDRTDAPGTGEFTIDWTFPPPDPAPVTTIAWRLAHIIIGVFGMRTAAHFGGPPVDHESYPYAGTAAEAVKQLDDAYALWIEGVRSLDAEGLARPCGEAEHKYADHPLAALVLHINREFLHHGAEIMLLTDLHQRTSR